MDIAPVIDVATGLSDYSGYHDWYETQKIQVLGSTTLYVDDLAGSHEFKFGAEYMYVHEIRDFEIEALDDPNFTGYPGILITYFGVPIMGNRYEDQIQKWAMSNIYAYAQDSWSIGKRLTLNLGIRFAHQRGIIPPQNE